MNSVDLIGRLTRDPEIRYTSGSQMAVATFSIAIDRPTKEGQQKQTDFPRITVFGKSAEACEKYLKQGRLIGVHGRIQTGSYQNKDGNTVYTTDVIAERVDFIDWGNENQQGRSQPAPQPQQNATPPAVEEQTTISADVPDNFEAIDEDVPF